MTLVDTHCHIQSIGEVKTGHTNKLWQELDQSANSVVDDANKNGVEQMICVGCDLLDSQLAIDFVQDRPNLFASIGIHPHEASHYQEKDIQLSQFTDLAVKSKVVAIGECGLDYFYNHSPKEQQEQVLRFQLNLAQQNNLPVIFHIRDAYTDFWPIFDSYKGALKGVLHSFTDSSDNLQLALERGLYIGVNGISTFTKDLMQQAMFKEVPIQRLLLESDSPYLTPVPYRGTINVPKRILNIAQFWAEFRGIRIEQISQQTTNNAHLLFGL